MAHYQSTLIKYNNRAGIELVWRIPDLILVHCQYMESEISDLDFHLDDLE